MTDVPVVTEQLQDKETKFIVAKAMIRACDNIKDKAIVIENNLGLDFCFSLIANGVTDEELAQQLDMKTGEVSLILKQTPILRKKYMEAKSFALADSSAQTLEKFTDKLYLSKEEKLAVDMHGKNLDRTLNHNSDERVNNGVVINNVLAVRNDKDVPEVPKELQEVIDVEFTEN